MKNLQLLFIIFIFISCTKNRDNIKVPPDRARADSSYQIIDIRFENLLSAKEEEIIEKRKSLIYNNRTQLTQKIIVDPGDLLESSLFALSEKKHYKVINDSSLFSVPVHIEDKNISLGDKKWIYSDKEVELPTKLTFKDSAYVSPNKKLLINLSIVYKKIQTRFLLKLQNKMSKNKIDVKGIWTGIYPSRINVSYKEQDF